MKILLVIAVLGFALWFACKSVFAIQRSADRLESVAVSEDKIWNGVTVSEDRRIFVNFPALSPRPIQGVGEIGANGRSYPYPGGDWNSWEPGKPVDRAFVGTNAVRIGPEGDLWVVDNGSPSFGAEIVPDAPKVVRIDIKSNTVARVYPLDSSLALPKSYVDDIRFHGHLAYLTDAGVPGVIVLDLDTGRGRRVLEHDRSTRGTRPINVDGEIVRSADHLPLILNADQMEVSPDGQWFYFQPLAGPMYRVATRWLDDPSIGAGVLEGHVEFWYDTPPLGGTAIDAAGNIYLEDLATDSILKLTPDRKNSTLIQDRRLHWVDAPWISKGWLYLPQAQVDRAGQFHDGQSQIRWPLHIFRIKLDE